jgi:coenzyme F420-reducing hydrogenase beta subunit
LFCNVGQIKQISKTRYIPVTLEKLFVEIDKIDGKIAISGVACFIKAIRLKQHYNPELKEKIPFLIGIICGGLKSKFFTDYLAQKSGIVGDYKKQEYRIKKPDSFALDYSFGAFDKQNIHHKVAMKTLGDMWGTGMFKSNACDFCDDVSAELADISLGDAWINPYDKEGLGNSVIVTRTSVADNLINSGINRNELSVKPIAVELFKLSQQGSFNHRHDGLKYRLDQLKKVSKIIPVKRNRLLISIPFYFKRVQKQRMTIREYSLKNWIISRDAIHFDSLMNPMKKKLLSFTVFYHRMRRLKRIFFKK